MMPSVVLEALVVLWSAVAPGGLEAAQEPRPEPAESVVAEEPVARDAAGRYSVRTREADGHWSAERGGGRADGDLRVTVWQLLAELGDGSTMRAGPARVVVKDAVKWLVAQQDDRGRIGLRADPDWLLDHTMATWALAEAMRVSAYGWLAGPVRAASAHIAEQVAVVRPPPDPELRLWCELLAASLAGIEALTDDGVSRGFEVGAAMLCMRLAALPEVAPATDRQRAAQLARETRIENSEARKSVAAGVIGAWPADPLVDPLATLYLAIAAFEIGGSTWREIQSRIEAGIVRQQIPRGDDRAGWPASGPFAVQNGRFGVQALTVVTMEIYYRYCRLGFWE